MAGCGKADFKEIKTMREITLFIAMSLDGYIADSQGGVGWLEGQETAGEEVDPDSEFIQDIDTVIMGWRTYHQIATELSPNEWPYKDLTSYVITHNRRESSEKIRFTDTNPADLLKELRVEDGKGIWIGGGSILVQQLVAENLIDRYYITIVPTLLGSGVRLFEHETREIKLRLIESKSYHGMTDLIYIRR